MNQKYQELLAHISVQYQEVFRKAIFDELREAGQDQTDSDMLHYLRQRLEEFRRGEYIRPDGKPGIIALGIEEMYERALPRIAAESSGQKGKKRRRCQPQGWRDRLNGDTLKVVALLLAALALWGGLTLNNRARQQPPVPLAAAALENGAVAQTAAQVEIPPTPTVVLPAGGDEALQTIGRLGGNLTLGRPGALEIRYLATEQVVALPIDPARVGNKGEMPYNETVMRSANPVAVWVFGTVINYAIGLPPHLVEALQPGDRLRLSTDTGASFSFVVTDRQTRSNHETGELLAQNRVGMTLFALPARSADDVAVAIAAYDLKTEEQATAVYRQLGEALFGGPRLTAVQFDDAPGGGLNVTVRGEGAGTGMVALQTARHQTTAVSLPAGAKWEVTFALPESEVGEEVTAVYRAWPTGESVFVWLGTVPRLRDGLLVSVPEAYWTAASSEMTVQVTVENPGPGQVRLPGNYLQVLGEGDSIYRAAMADSILEAGAKVTLRVTFPQPRPEQPFVTQVDQMAWGKR